MTDTDQLVVWLRETMDAAERAANRAAALCGCHPPAPSWTFGDETTDGRILVVGEPHPGLKRKIGRRWNGSYEGMAMAEHVVRHDPHAVLRRIAADRKILAEHKPTKGDTWDGSKTVCDTCANASREEVEGEPYPCTTVRLLAEGWGWTEGEQR